MQSPEEAQRLLQEKLARAKARACHEHFHERRVLRATPPSFVTISRAYASRPCVDCMQALKPGAGDMVVGGKTINTAVPDPAAGGRCDR